MESQIAPPVVAVMVVHEPGDWFEETLRTLAEQDYTNLRTIFLVTSADPDDPEDETVQRIRTVIPDSFIRPAITADSFPINANEVLRLVEGDNGFFLICQDDIAMAPNAVRLLVAELFRSNAGIVGPKLLDWDYPQVLQHVGLGVDRLGEIDPLVEPGEADQEQHDAVSDVFAVPTACMLVRADLFRTLGGFDPSINFYGEEIDLCWRAHHTGARVIVAPDARVRHRERLDERRPDLPHRALQSRHRMRNVATLTGASRLFGRSVQMVLVTVVELIVGLFTGRLGEAAASVRALVGLIGRTGSILARRRAIAKQRIVPEREVLGLQVRGSSRLTSYLRGRETAMFIGDEATTVRRWRQTTYGPLLAWFLFIVAVLIGSRRFITSGVPPVGEFLPFPDSALDLWQSYASPFDARGLGATAATPTGWATIAISSVVSLFNMALFQTITVIGMYIIGAMGAWRLAQVFPINRARIAAMVVYAGTPLVPSLLGNGQLSALVWYAALPWLVHHLRRIAALEPADPDAVGLDLTDGIAPVTIRHRLRAAASGVIILGLCASIVPVTIVVWLAVGATLAMATLLAFGDLRVAAWLGGGAAAIAVGGFALNIPWSLSWSWADVMGVPTGATGRSLVEIAPLADENIRFGVLGIALYVPVLAALVITRAWRFTWSVRALMLVVVFGAGIIVSEFGLLDLNLPDTTILAVPVVLGLALAAAALAGGFSSDVIGRDFGWRQPFGLLATTSLVVGLVPAALSVGGGAWNTDTIPLVELLNTQFRADGADGDYRVLYVGDPDVLPLAGRRFADDVAYAVVDSGSFDVTDIFATPHTRGDDTVAAALQMIAEGSTLRAGRVLAPLGIRYVVIPESTRLTGVDEELDAPLPSGLLEAFGDQLDMGRVEATVSVNIFRNEAFIPVGATLSEATAEASNQAGAATLARADMTHSTPALPGIDGRLDDETVSGPVGPGVTHIGIPFENRIQLDVDGTRIAPRPGFGVSTAFDVPTAGTATVIYEADSARRPWIIAQGVLWLIVLAAAFAPRTLFGRRRMLPVNDETLIDLDTESEPMSI